MKNEKPLTFKRVLAYLIDLFVIMTPFYILFSLMPIIYPYSQFILYEIGYILVFFIYVFSIFIVFLYLLVKDSLFNGRSIGKRLLGLQVVDNKGNPCSVKKSLLRNFTLLIPFIPIIEFFKIRFNEKGERLGDSVAGTRVIRASKIKNGAKNRIYSILFFAFITLVYVSLFAYGSLSLSRHFNNYIYLEPEENLSYDQLENSRYVLQLRLDLYRIPAIVYTRANNLLVVKAHDDLVENIHVLENSIKTSCFQAKIGNETIFSGGDDIVFVCTSDDCSGIDPQRGCIRAEGGWFCSFRFSITLSQETANRQAQATKDLVPSFENTEYLSEPLDIYLDDQLFDTLRIGTELKGRPITDVQISGLGSGVTEHEALKNALESMSRLQIAIITGCLPTNFEIVKIE